MLSTWCCLVYQSLLGYGVCSLLSKFVMPVSGKIYYSSVDVSIVSELYLYLIGSRSYSFLVCRVVGFFVVGFLVLFFGVCVCCVL